MIALRVVLLLYLAHLAIDPDNYQNYKFEKLHVAIHLLLLQKILTAFLQEIIICQRSLFTM